MSLIRNAHGALIISLAACATPPPASDLFGGPVGESSSGLIAELYGGMASSEKVYGHIAHLYGQEFGEDGDRLAAGLLVLDGIDVRGGALRVDVTVEVPGYVDAYSRTVDVAPDDLAFVPLDGTWRVGKIRRLNSNVSVEFNARISPSRGDAFSISEVSKLQPVDRVPWFIEDELNGGFLDFRPLAITLVTPDDPAVDDLLRDAIDYIPDGNIAGYQGDREAVLDEVNGIYDALKDRGVAYSNIPGTFYDREQRVRLPADALAARSANCVDGSLLFASAMEAMGLETYLVFMDGHAQVAFLADPETLYIIETTVLSQDTFVDALYKGLARFELALESDPMFLTVDITEARRNGITPFPL